MNHCDIQFEIRILSIISEKEKKLKLKSYYFKRDNK